MNYPIVIKVLGSLILFESIGMIPSLFIALYTGQNDAFAFFCSILLCVVAGFSMTRIRVKTAIIKTSEGFAIVTFGWIFASIFGALPFVISGAIPSFVDAFFETVSGFTTTGATILDNIEILPMGILFWRSFTHWVGGMGILVFTVAVLPAIGIGGFQIFKAESPGPIADKLVPRIKDTAKILYITYLSISIAEVVLLMFGGMSLFESIVHTFGTLGTGGFSTRNSSIGAFDSSYIHIVISIFMLMSGTNFSLYYEILKGKWRNVFKNQEFRFYYTVVFISVILIASNIYKSSYQTIGEALKYSFFQVSSIITTTGYATADFDLWPTFSKMILFLLMFLGGCAGSTGGGMKQIRVLLLLKIVKREFSKLFHPRAMIPVKVGNRIISQDILSNVSSFFILYIALFIGGSLIVSLEGISLVSASSAVAATLGNIGPGFELVGASRTYSHFSSPIKVLLSFFMLAGRLELFTVIALLSPAFWRKEG